MNDLQNLLENDLPDGITKRFDCPSCGGDHSLSITNQAGTLIYNCFKASCGLKGVKGGTLSLNDIRTKRLKEQFKPFELPEYIIRGLINEDCYDLLTKYQSLDAYTKRYVNIGYDPRLHRLVFFLEDSQKNIIGAVGRALKHGSIPKVYNYPNSCVKPLEVGLNTDIGVIVEDAFSACSISRIGVTGICIFGTNIKQEYIKVLKQFKNIYIALDKDAIRKSLYYVNTLKYYGINAKLVPLEKDFKNLSLEDLTNQYNYLLKDK